MASLPGGPLNQSDEVLAFLAGYGWTMWAVQVFEYRLAGLSTLRAPVKQPTRVLNTAQEVYGALQKQFATSEHRFERASAKELRNLLPEDFPGSLKSELDELIDIRNDLAHRYLRRTMQVTTPPDFRQELQQSKRSASGSLRLARSFLFSCKRPQQNALPTFRTYSSKRCSGWDVRRLKEPRSMRR
jgi:hypothetical protein